MSDTKFFTKGKAAELEAELKALDKANKPAKKKDVLKRIIANMTMGADMSSLAHHVIQCSVLPGNDTKKLIHLYLVHYAGQVPDLATLAVNLLIKDSNDPNPLVRAAALRTMGYIQAEDMMNSLVDMIRPKMTDPDPFVRKTTVICIGKLYQYNADMFDRESLVEVLQAALLDDNPSVMATAFAVYREITESHPTARLILNVQQASKLVTALNECSEWYQIYILEALCHVQPTTADEGLLLAERLGSRLQHGNSAVSLTTIKAMLHLLSFVIPVGAPAPLDQAHPQYATIRGLCAKLAPPLVTYMARGPEIQYTALRNIVLIVEAFPGLLQAEPRVFFVKYTDPIYVKLAKLDVLAHLVTKDSAPAVLAELKEYATEVDLDFVRRSVRYIGRLAVQLSDIADACMQAIGELISQKKPYVLQEAVVVCATVFRRYPGRYEGMLAQLTENLDAIDEPDARAAYIWIIGQYSGRIDGAADALALFGKPETCTSDLPPVQLALITAVTKAAAANVTGAQAVAQAVLGAMVSGAENPDVRDRAIMAWRLLAKHPESARRIFSVANRPVISDKIENVPGLFDLVTRIGTLASVLYKPPSAFLGKRAPQQQNSQPRSQSSQSQPQSQSQGSPSMMVASSASPISASSSSPSHASSPSRSVSPGSGGGNGGMNLLDLDDSGPVLGTPNVGLNAGSSPSQSFASAMSGGGGMPVSPSQSSHLGAAFGVPSMPAGGYSPVTSAIGGGGGSTNTTISASTSYYGGMSASTSYQGAGTGTSVHGGLAALAASPAASPARAPLAPFGGAAMAAPGSPARRASGGPGQTLGPAAGPMQDLLGFASLGATSGSPACIPTIQTGGIGGNGGAAAELLAAGIGSMLVASPFPDESRDWLSATDGKGLAIRGTFRGVSPAQPTDYVLEMTLTNRAMAPMAGFMLKLNANAFGVQVANPALAVASLAPNSSQQLVVALTRTPGQPIPEQARADPMFIQAAVKSTAGVAYFVIPVPIHAVIGQYDSSKVPEAALVALLQNPTTAVVATPVWPAEKLFAVARRAVEKLGAARLGFHSYGQNSTRLCSVLVTQAAVVVEVLAVTDPASVASYPQLGGRPGIITKVFCKEDVFMPSFRKFVEDTVTKATTEV
ncbi:adaptin N terminal region-domain-containing protein [Blastocladiella britannica]|nr:adaptin N terminal region-domain-containing protein [Blastocladiella britannica]